MNYLLLFILVLFSTVGIKVASGAELEVAAHFGMPCFEIRDILNDPSIVERIRSKEFLVESYSAVKNLYEQCLSDFQSLLASGGLKYRDL